MKFVVSPEVKELGIDVCMAIIRDVNIVNKNASLEKLKKEVLQKVCELITKICNGKYNII